jgi:PleD family two-component response regulator
MRAPAAGSDRHHLGRADAALCTAKKAGRNQVSYLASASAVAALKIARA